MTKTTTPPFKCQTCGKEMKNAMALMGHTNRMHGAKATKKAKKGSLTLPDILAIMRVKRDAISDLITLLENF